jgi:carbamoyl-phosphate synthase large subunit
MIEIFASPYMLKAAGWTVEQAAAIAQSLGFPVLMRPSFVLGGRAMVIVYDEAALRKHASEAFEFHLISARRWTNASAYPLTRQ